FFGRRGWWRPIWREKVFEGVLHSHDFSMHHSQLLDQSSRLLWRLALNTGISLHGAALQSVVINRWSFEKRRPCRDAVPTRHRMVRWLLAYVHRRGADAHTRGASPRTERKQGWRSDCISNSRQVTAFLVPESLLWITWEVAA